MTLRNQLRDLGMKLDMAAQELRAIRDPRGPDGNEQLRLPWAPWMLPSSSLTALPATFPDMNALLSVLQRKERGRVALTIVSRQRQTRLC